MNAKHKIKLQETLADLEMQSLAFDMDIDVETLKLTPKRTSKEPIWITRWKERRSGQDFDEQIDIDRE